MDEMRQVSRTVATVVLLLLILPRPAKLHIGIDKSAELEKIENNIEYTFGSMEKQLEAGNEIDLEDSNLLSKAFVQLGNYVTKETKRKSNITIKLPSETKKLIMDILSGLL
ncbi:uncharacterized protein LOC108148603 [Drosophila elegans]|uniref:uncharacterized protein LOC108148603 n=1 Tax=Drosophila elegans TaxID=30023 RepID=UPI0007E5BF7C|nr:uncharacterized protein LOC108148603 [Drosophila elegans]